VIPIFRDDAVFYDAQMHLLVVNNPLAYDSERISFDISSLISSDQNSLFYVQLLVVRNDGIFLGIPLEPIPSLLSESDSRPIEKIDEILRLNFLSLDDTPNSRIPFNQFS
jgi:hypothetical protein